MVRCLVALHDAYQGFATMEGLDAEQEKTIKGNKFNSDKTLREGTMQSEDLKDTKDPKKE
ncbi:hypothetical protein EJB05_36798 [Eragrostis curvula]|uniref:Uncharacterized protein n=1 Tax=Eragrostis curvula TaxID=38414 RepID=A0A5J9UAS2_9POAL|nr:hypothetical protein EJB05_36798 [Eragrostis curvula]